MSARNRPLDLNVQSWNDAVERLEIWGSAMKQDMNLDAPPRGELPNWGKRVHFDNFFVELVPVGKRAFNVRLADTFASISFGADEGRSSLAGGRLRRYDRRPHEYIVTPPNFPLRGASDAAPEVLALVFRFDDIKLKVEAALQIPEDTLEPRVIIGGPKSFTTELAQRIRRHMLMHDVSTDYLEALCFLLIVEMIRLPPQQRKSARSSKLDDNVLQLVLSYIDANIDADLSLEALAGLSGVLTHQFARAFKNKVGEPPHHYVLNCRIKAARELLNTTAHPIADIAYATGFSSQSHMTTTFRREIGVTPAQLRSENVS